MYKNTHYNEYSYDLFILIFLVFSQPDGFGLGEGGVWKCQKKFKFSTKAIRKYKCSVLVLKLHLCQTHVVVVLLMSIKTCFSILFHFKWNLIIPKFFLLIIQLFEIEVG